jgi:hypothetical protein
LSLFIVASFIGSTKKLGSSVLIFKQKSNPLTNMESGTNEIAQVAGK